MSRTASGAGAEGPGGFPRSPAQAYFRAIEALFLELRGSPLTLGPADWQKAREWQEAGLPLDLVLSTLRELFVRRREQGREDKVWSLAQCGRAVRTAWKRHLALTAASRAGEGAVPAAPLAERLDRLAAAVPDALPGHAELRRRIRELAGEADEEAVEAALARLDAEAFGAALAGLTPTEAGEVAAEVARSRQALASRLPSAELATAERELAERAVRRRKGLPVLSLFAAEASEAGGEP